MRVLWCRVSVLALLATLGCSSENGTNPSIESIGDVYTGQIAGNDQGSILQGTLSLDIEQSGSSLSGSWTLAANLSNSSGPSTYDAAGSFSGTIGPGDDPSLTISIIHPVCPVYEIKLLGKYGSLTKAITLSGVVPLYDNGCNATYAFQSTIILNR